jgi:hypothetical protein
MESEKSYEPKPSPTPEAAEAIEAVSIDALPERLGFIETPDLAQIRAQLTEAMALGYTHEVEALATRYHELGEQLVNKQQGDNFARAQIGLALSMALMRRDAQRTDAYIQDLVLAIEYADNMGYSDVTAAIQTALIDAESTPEAQHHPDSQEIATLLRDFGEEFGFDEQTCAEIADLPFEQAFETAYGYLAQAGLDADEILQRFVE